MSILEMRIVKLEQVDKNSAHEQKNTLIMAGTIPPAQHAEDSKSIEREQIREHLHIELVIEDSNVKMFYNSDVKQNIIKSC